jgi:hypothetical protein
MYQNRLYLHNPEEPHTQAYRARAIAIDLAGIRRQGVEPVPDFFAIAERYVSGELGFEQFVAAIEGLRRRQTARPFPPPPERTPG